MIKSKAMEESKLKDDIVNDIISILESMAEEAQAQITVVEGYVEGRVVWITGGQQSQAEWLEEARKTHAVMLAHIEELRNAL